MSTPVIPTLSQIYDRICTDIELYLPDANARATESLLSTLAAAEAGAVHELYGFLQWVVQQLLPDSADEDNLQRWADMLDVSRLDGESADAWRSRIVSELRERSQIGDADDYIRWVRASSADITNAWLDNSGDMPLGNIHIYCVTGNLPSPIPTAELLSEISNTLDRVRNVCGVVRLLAPTSRRIDIRIAGVTDVSMQASIAAELGLLISRKWRSAASLLEAEVDAAIQRYTLNYTLLAPIGDTQAAANELLVLGDVSWLV